MRGLLFLTALASVSMSCARHTPAPAETGHGALTLALTALDAEGVNYRLRNAQFDLWGYIQPAFHETISTEDDPDAALIVRRLLPGTYAISLTYEDWYLERVRATGSERVDRAVLLSEPWQEVSVWDGGLTQVSFRFGVDGELIDFRSGELQVSIEIEKPGEHCPEPSHAGGAGGVMAEPRPVRPCGDAGAAGTAGTAGSPGDGDAGAET